MSPSSSLDKETLDRIERLIDWTKEHAWVGHDIMCRNCVVDYGYECHSCEADFNADVREEERKHKPGCQLEQDVAAMESFVRIERGILDAEEEMQWHREYMAKQAAEAGTP